MGLSLSRVFCSSLQKEVDLVSDWEELLQEETNTEAKKQWNENYKK